jgi:hypothetical protein
MRVTLLRGVVAVPVEESSSSPEPGAARERDDARGAAHEFGRAISDCCAQALGREDRAGVCVGVFAEPARKVRAR